MNHRPPGELPGGLDLFGGEMGAGGTIPLPELARRIERALRTVPIGSACEHLVRLGDDEYMVLAAAVAVDLIEEGR